MTRELSDEFKQEEKAILDKYDNDTFASFDLRILGADELVSMINALEKQNRKIDAEIRIRYDANNPSLIKYYVEGLKGLVCTASATEIARIVNNDPDGSVFDANIRRYLGNRGAVNNAIFETCTTATESNLFWFLNNGITIVCDSFDPIPDPDNPHVKIKNMQIVNGCQTATTLALAERKGTLTRDVRVLLRIYETTNTGLVDRIVLTTNNQNRIKDRDLKSNDQQQVDMERGFARFGYFYERKARQYDKQMKIDVSKIVVNEQVAQSYLAIVLQNPSDASRRKYKIWGEFYNKIFAGHIIEQYVLAYLIYRHSRDWLEISGYTESDNELRRKLANSGAFHLARVIAFMWRGSDSWSKNPQDYEKGITLLRDQSSVLDSLLESALTHLELVINSSQDYSLSEIDTALKSSILDNDITRSLHSKKKQ